MATYFRNKTSTAIERKKNIKLLLSGLFPQGLFRRTTFPVIFCGDIIFFNNSFNGKLRPIDTIYGTWFRNPFLRTFNRGVDDLRVGHDAIICSIARLIMGVYKGMFSRLLANRRVFPGGVKESFCEFKCSSHFLFRDFTCRFGSWQE